jgi:hypothetical protein
MVNWRTLVLGCAVLAGGCACRNSANTPLLASLDRAVQPKTTGQRILYGIPLVPAATVAALVDIAVIHPARSLGYAAEVTRSALWTESAGTYTERTLVFVPKVLVTPVVYAGAWLVVSLFDLPPQKEPAKNETPPPPGDTRPAL